MWQWILCPGSLHLHVVFLQSAHLQANTLHVTAVNPESRRVRWSAVFVAGGPALIASRYYETVDFPVALWLKLPSRLKILVKNSTSVLSIHLDQVPARSVGWPLVKLFPFKSPITCCLDPFFLLLKFYHPIPPSFSYNRPGLSLWQVPPISFLYLLHTSLSPSYRPGLSLWQVPPILFFFLSHLSLSLSLL